MPLELTTILDAVKTLGVPTAYLGFTMWLLLREQNRTREAEARNTELQAKVFALGQSVVEAAMRNEAAITALTRRDNTTGQWSVPDAKKPGV